MKEWHGPAMPSRGVWPAPPRGSETRRPQAVGCCRFQRDQRPCPAHCPGPLRQESLSASRAEGKKDWFSAIRIPQPTLPKEIQTCSTSPTPSPCFHLPDGSLLCPRCVPLQLGLLISLLTVAPVSTWPLPPRNQDPTCSRSSAATEETGPVSKGKLEMQISM